MSSKTGRCGSLALTRRCLCLLPRVSATWENTRNQIKPLSRSDVFQSVPSDSTLACPLCSKLLRSAVQTPCCSTRYCEECIQNHLLEHDFSCPECEKRIGDLTTLKRDDETRKKVESYVEEAVGKSEEEVKEREESEAKAKAEKEESERKIKEEEEEAATTTANGQPTGEESVQGKEGEAAQAGAVSTSGTPPSTNPNMPSNVPVVMFNPQLVQQLVMTLSNPRLPPPMRMMLQTQLQAQQMAFIRMQSNGGAGGATGGAGAGAGMNGGMGGMPGAGAGAGWQAQQGFRPMNMQQQQMNPRMGMNGMSGMGNMRMGMNNPAAAMGMGMNMGMMNRPGMPPGAGVAANGSGGPMDGGAYNRARK